ncbi:hypothetical protein [Clostridium sp. YIM B02555]|uniref:hypothetical protein n=1 Tax=Clostridium sp. YIM B02555 TaxID=2911968 RepID=UPI001EEF1B24|nr:hypothetical protein [Clostridium sp. YIM B02555]
MRINEKKDTKENLNEVRQDILRETRDIDITELKIAFGNIIKRTSTKISVSSFY